MSSRSSSESSWPERVAGSDQKLEKNKCGFVQDAGTRNAIFMVRMISERAIEKQRDVYMCFIDYTFDEVKHENLLGMLMNLDLHGKDIRIIRNLYWDQTACIRIGNEMSNFISIKRGVRQGCVSPLISSTCIVR